MICQSKLTTRMKIAVYCGSFAPVHLGHIAIAQAVVEEGKADCVLFVPTGDYWDKEVAFDRDLRISLLKIYENKKILVDEDEEDSKCVRTYDLLKRLKEKYPEDELILLIGGDNAVNIDRWYQSEYLLANYQLIIMPRAPYHKEDIIMKMAALGKKDYQIIDLEVMDISSSYIRNNLSDWDKLKDIIDRQEYDLLIKALDK